MKPLAGHLVVDLTRYLPGAFASRELQRLGARVVRLEPPEGDPMRHVAPAWDEALNAGKESVACDLKLEPELAQALLARADVVLEGFRPGELRFGLQIAGDRLLAGVQRVVPGRRDVAHRIALRRLDPHHARAEPLQLPGRERAREVPRQVDDEMSGQRLHRR